MASVKDIDACLPQTQCAECDYPGCLPYAEAIASGQASIDKCPPGGTKTLHALANLLNVDPEPYVEEVKANTRVPQVAVIREDECIGCTKCIQACPVDAIIGSAKSMHSIIDHECTGCNLCVEPCPVDCIEMQTLPELGYNEATARKRFHARQARLLRQTQEKKQAYLNKRRISAESSDKKAEKKAKQDYILQALQRVKSKHE